MTTTAPPGATVREFYQQTRRELLAGLKLAAAIRKAINRADRKRRPALREKHFPRLAAAQRRLAFYRGLVWVGDTTVFLWGYGLALPRCAAAIRSLEEMAAELGLTEQAGALALDTSDSDALLSDARRRE